MAFNYNTLKQITTDGLIDGTIVAGDIGTGAITVAKITDGNITGGTIIGNAVTTAKIAAGTITSTNMGTGAVLLDSAKVSQTLPVAKGGTAIASVSADRTLMANTAGSALEYSTAGLVSVDVFTSGGTWNRPAGCSRVRVQVVGGGGGGSGHGEAGGSGGYTERILDVTGISSVSVTVGGGGGGVTYHNVGGNGAASSFGPYASASAGEGARAVGGHTGGRPGIGSGGNMNIYGGGGSGHTHYGGGQGGRSYFGGPSIGVHAESPDTAAYESWAAPGTGGTGGSVARHRGASGRTGMVIVWNFR